LARLFIYSFKCPFWITLIGVFWLRSYRWVNGVRCPRCGSCRVIRHGRLHYQPEFHRYLCRDCGGTFNDRTGTFLHYSRIGVDEFVLEVLLLLYMSVSAVSKLMERSYRYCYKLFTRFLPRLSISMGVYWWCC